MYIIILSINLKIIYTYLIMWYLYHIKSEYLLQINSLGIIVNTHD